MGRLFEGVHWRRRITGRGASPWVPQILAGTDDGYFGPGSAAWVVNGSLPTLVAGIRALLVQALHPGAMAGVHDHSRYREDTIGRLNGTIRWVATTTFGDKNTAQASAQAVRHIHESIVGTYTDARGDDQPYAANDPQLMRWVHDAFTIAFLGAHQTWGVPIPGGPDQYVEEWARSGTLLGVVDPPRSLADLEHEMREFTADLVFDERVKETVGYLKKPRLPLGIRLVYPVLFGGAVASLATEHRALLGLRRPRWPAITTCRILLWTLGLMLGKTSPSERAALERSRRLRADAASESKTSTSVSGPKRPRP